MRLCSNVAHNVCSNSSPGCPGSRRNCGMPACHALLLCRGVQLATEAGAQDAGSRDGALPLEVLPRLPLRDLLNLYGVLATWVADTFAAGPVDLGPDFEVRFGPSASTARAS